MSILVFDIESVPDYESGRKIHKLSDDLSDKDVVKAMQHLQFQKSGSEFMPLHLQKIVAISVVFEKHDQLKVWSLGNKDSDEKEIIQVELVEKLMDELSPRQREVLYLRFYGELSPSEIADIMSLNYQTVINHFYEAIKTLRKHKPTIIKTMLGAISAILMMYGLV